MSPNSIIAGLLALLAVSIIGFEGYLIALKVTQPMKYISVTTTTPVVREGESIVLQFVVERVRACKTTLNRFIVEEKDNEIVWRESVAGGLGGLGHIETKGTIRLPTPLTPGKYRFETLLYADCYEGQHTASHVPVQFEVVK